MEKPRPTFDLQAFKSLFGDPDRLEMTTTARNDALALGLNRGGVAAVIRSMERSHFYKSMTSFADHKKWQDVYHVPWDDQTIYLKFTADEVTEFRVLSFKEK